METQTPPQVETEVSDPTAEGNIPSSRNNSLANAIRNELGIEPSDFYNPPVGPVARAVLEDADIPGIESSPETWAAFLQPFLDAEFIHELSLMVSSGNFSAAGRLRRTDYRDHSQAS